MMFVNILNLNSDRSYILWLLHGAEAHNGKSEGHPGKGRGDRKASGYFKASDFLDVWDYKSGRSSAIHTGRLYTRRNPWYSLSGAESSPGYLVP